MSDGLRISVVGTSSLGFSTHARRQRDFLAAMRPHWLRLRSRAAIDAWLRSLHTSG